MTIVRVTSQNYLNELDLINMTANKILFVAVLLWMIMMKSYHIPRPWLRLCRHCNILEID